jgi:flagellar assembly protein FliH
MSAAPAPKAMTPEDLLALVRQSSQSFQKKGVVQAEDTGVVQDFVPQNLVRRAEEALPPTAPLPNLEETPEIDALTPEAGDMPSSGGDAETDADGFSPAEPPKVIDMETERQAAWTAGYEQAMQEIDAARSKAREEALAEARAEADATLEEVRSAFEAALARLNSAEEEVAAALTTHLEMAVRILASDRAGQKIDDTPQPFLRRVEKMARDIAAGAESLVVQMNPADLMAIKPHIKSFSPLSKARLAPDPSLGRGDLRLNMDEITFADVIAERKTGGLR